MTQTWQLMRKSLLDDIKYGAYQDKTVDLAHFKKRGNYCICAPSGYGKTTLLTTVGCLFGVNLNAAFYKTNFKKRGMEYLNFILGSNPTIKLEVMNNEIKNEFGRYIPVYFSFPKSCENYYQEFVKQIMNTFKKFEETFVYAEKTLNCIRKLHLNTEMKEIGIQYKSYLTHWLSVCRNLNLSQSLNEYFEKNSYNLQVLFNYLYAFLRRPIILLIDNCEQVLLASQQYPDQSIDVDEYLSMFSNFVSTSSVRFSIFSTALIDVVNRPCFGNAVVFDLVDNRLDSFGFTKNEVEKLCYEYKQIRNCQELLDNGDFIQSYNCRSVVEFLKGISHIEFIKGKSMYNS